MLQFDSHQTLGYTTRCQKKRATIATDNCFKVGNACNVVVLFRTATVGSTLHILPCGTVSTFYRLLTCIVKPARHYGRQTSSSLYITVSVVPL